MLASSVVDVGLSPAPGQTKGLKNWYLLLSAHHAALKSKSKDWLCWNQDNV